MMNQPTYKMTDDELRQFIGLRSTGIRGVMWTLLVPADDARWQAEDVDDLDVLEDASQHDQLTSSDVYTLMEAAYRQGWNQALYDNGPLAR